MIDTVTGTLAGYLAGPVMTANLNIDYRRYTNSPTSKVNKCKLTTKPFLFHWLNSLLGVSQSFIEVFFFLKQVSVIVEWNFCMSV